MPWIVKENGGSCSGEKPWAVLNQKTGDLVACHATKEKARAQQRALYASEPGLAAFKAEPYTGDGGMVALYPAADQAKSLAQPDGQAASDLHVTLCFLPHSADLVLIGPILAGISEEYEELTGKVTGVAQFHKGNDGVPVVALPSVIGLDRLRVEVARALGENQILYAANYGFIPHITLGYDIEEPLSVLNQPLTFAALTFVDVGTHHDYRFRAPSKTTEASSNLMNMSELLFHSTGTATFTTASNGTSSSSPVTITITTNGSQEDAVNTGEAWESVLAVEGSPSSDRRYLIPAEITERDLPLPLRVTPQDGGGHDGAVQVGRIESIQHIPVAEFTRSADFNLGDLPTSAIVIWGEGVFDGPDDMVELAQTMINNGAGISLDLPHDRLALIDPETFEEVPEDEIEMADVLSGKYLTGIGGKIAAATIVDIPAFEEASIRLSDTQAVVASAYGIRLRHTEALVASVGLAPLAPPKAWFEMPEPNEPTPLTVTDDGQVFGHLATWNQCHASFPNYCQRPYRSKSKYRFFHLGSIFTSEGDAVPVGRITVGKGNSLKGGHDWDLWSGAKGAIEHYDKTGSVAAFVRAKDGKHGIWLCGATRSDASAEAIRDMRANPPSGDWRWENGGMELVAALSVPVPGFPVPYLTSSSGEHPLTLIATGYIPEATVGPRESHRKRALLTAKAREELAAGTMTCPECGDTIPAGSATCPDCGYDLEDQAEGMAAKKKAKGMGGVVITPGYADEPWMTADEVDELGSLSIQTTDGAEVKVGKIVQEFAYNAAQRRKMAKSGEALPDGSFPIASCADAENAIHAQGRAKNQDEAVGHIKKRVSALNCSGDIFKPYK